MVADRTCSATLLLLAAAVIGLWFIVLACVAVAAITLAGGGTGRGFAAGSGYTAFPALVIFVCCCVARSAGSSRGSDISRALNGARDAHYETVRSCSLRSSRRILRLMDMSE